MPTRAASAICPMRPWCSTRSVAQSMPRVPARLCGVPVASSAGIWDRWRWRVSWAWRLTLRHRCFARTGLRLPWLRRLGAGRVYLPAELVADDAERVAELAACPGVLGPVDADRPELMVCEHCLLTAEGACATDATGQVRCRDCSRRQQARFLVERDGTRLPVVVDVCGRTRIFLS